MQIAAGKLKGKKLIYPARGLRPTTDKIRSAVFNIVEANFPDLLAGALVCDIFCGAGAVGIEALSRGAKSAVFIDNDRFTLKYLQKNLAGLVVDTNLIVLDAIKALPKLSGEKFDLIFLDPPYNMNLVEPAIKKIAEYDLLAQKGIVIVEHHKKEIFIVPELLVVFKEKRYSDKVITILNRRAS